MEELIPRWILWLMIIGHVAIMMILTLVFLPRLEEIRQLRERISKQKKQIKALSESATAAQIESDETIEAEKGARLEAEGRAKQNANRAKRIARAAGRDEKPPEAFATIIVRELERIQKYRDRNPEFISDGENKYVKCQ